VVFIVVGPWLTDRIGLTARGVSAAADVEEAGQ
jgi:hypothetical protein